MFRSQESQPTITDPVSKSNDLVRRHHTRKTRRFEIMAPNKKIEPKQKLDLENVFCIACRCIYIQPVTMPCGHTLCLECFKNMVNITAYQCPLCRKRISNWLRKYKHDWNSMVNKSLWEAVLQQYPVEVQKKLNDEDDGLEERIVNQGFTRIPIQEGEIKKEFDDMLMVFNQEHKEKELQNLEMAKKLQEEEITNEQLKNTHNEQFVQNDISLASSIQEKINNELQQEETLLNELDMQIAMQLQNQMSELGEILKNRPKTFDTKQKKTRKGPLDIMFAKITSKNAEIQYTSNKNNCSYSSSQSSSFTLSNSLKSSSGTNLCTSSSLTDSSALSINENLETCTCGRLQYFNSQNLPCQFCIVQMDTLNKIQTQQKNDFLMAKDLEQKFKMKNVQNNNLRKRPSPTLTRSISTKKISKLSKGQLTLKQVLG